MKTLLNVFHSMNGGTRQMAEAAVRGAAETEPGLRARVLRAPEAGPSDLLGADGSVFATPENLAAMAGLMKDSRMGRTTERTPVFLGAAAVQG